MADTKLSALTALATTPADADEFYINDGAVSKKITYGTIKTAFATAAQGSTADSALQNIVEDMTPQLGGNLDVQARTITTSTVNGGITLSPDGTGNVTLGTFVLDGDATIGAGQDGYVLTYDNASGTWGPEAASGGGSGDFLADGSVDMTGELKTDVGTFGSDVANSASAVGFRFGTVAAYSTTGAKLLVLDNAGTDVFGFSYQGGISHLNSLATTAAHAQSLNLNWVAAAARTSSGSYSAVIGLHNTASGSGALAVGSTNTASGNNSQALGQGCLASQANSFAQGLDCTAAGNYAAAMGAYASNANRVTFAYGGGRHAADGDAQALISVLRAATTDATITTMQAYNTNYVIPADTTWYFSAMIVGRSDEADGNDSAAYRIEGVLTRDEANNTALVGSVTKTVIAESAGATAWDATVEADDTNEVLAVKVTGEAGTNIRWTARIDTVVVAYA